MRLLFAASEIFPFAKTGGLADVAAALPKALCKHIDVVSVMPLYGFMQTSELKHEDFNFSISLGGITYKIDIYSQKKQRVKIYFIKAALLSATQEPYSDTNLDLRFAIFSMAVVELALHVKADILHLNDWHTALCALFVKERALDIKTVFTIHNLAYQGVFEHSCLKRTGIDERYFNMDALEFYGSVNFMKAGIAYSDMVTTVSPQYAKEILTPKFGCGLDGFLRVHKDKLVGILNGIDDSFFNPATDKYIVKNYDDKSIKLKYENKKALLKELELKDPRRALFSMISRLVQQKGFDLLLDSLNSILKFKINFVLLVDGESHYMQKLEKIALKHNNFRVLFGYDESLSHRIYSSSDFLLMPSLFEPCGLNQMIAMRYGTTPVVHSVGGLYDSVHEDSRECGRGVVFSKPSKKAFTAAVQRALKLKSDTIKLDEIIGFNMRCDFSFDKRALSYMKLYKDFYD